MRFLLIGSLFFCVLTSLLSADPIRLFYDVGTKTYEVSVFEDGLPVLDTEVGPDVERIRSDEKWSYSGELPLDPEFIAGVYTYYKSKQPKNYVTRNSPDQYRIDLTQDTFISLSWSGDDLRNGIVVFGWIVDGVVDRVLFSKSVVHLSYDNELTLGGESIDPDGYLVAWLVREGRIVPLWEYAAFQEYSIFDETKNYRALGAIVDAAGNTALHLAALNGDITVVKGLVEKAGLKVNVVNRENRTPLHYAAQNGRNDVVAYLLKKEAKVYVLDSKGVTPRSFAALGGHLSTVKLLAPDKPRGSKEKLDYSAATVNALSSFNQAVTIYFLEHGGDLKLSRKNASSLALELMTNGMTELADWIRKNERVDPMYSEKGFNFLHAVAGYADIDLLEKLKNEGVSVNQVSDSGLTPAIVATGLGNVQAICWFMENGGRTKSETALDPILHAITYGASSSVSCLIDYGFDINREHDKGFTPVMYACSRGERVIAETLFEVGGIWLFDSPISDDLIIDAIELDSKKVMLALMDQGLEIDRKIFGDISINDIAAFYQSNEVSEFLSEMYPETNVTLEKSSKSKQPLEIVRRSNFEYPIEMLKKFGDLDILVDLAVLPTGEIGLINVKNDVADDIRLLVENQMRSWRFKVREGEDSLATVSYKLPLRVVLREEDIFELNMLSVAPKSLHQVKPRYPASLKAIKKEGYVTIEWVIDSRGRVLFPKAIESSSIEFEVPAIEAIKESAWSPGMKDGKAVAVRVRQRMDFSL